jgi:MraZ protein
MEAKTDMKGRVFLPAQFRKQLQVASEETLIMQKDAYACCLVLYPHSVWNSTQQELRTHLRRWNPKHEMVWRQFVSDVEVVVPDSNGRILIPKRYLNLAGICDEVRFIGVGDKIEIWAKEKAEAPFMPPADFAAALEEIMSNDVAQ